MNQTAVCGLCDRVGEIVNVIFEEMRKENLGVCVHCEEAINSEVEARDDFHFSENMDARY